MQRPAVGGEADGGGGAAEEAAAGDGGEDEVGGGEVGGDLKAAGGLAGDDVGVIVGRDDGVAVPGGELFGLELAGAGGRADEDDFGAEGPGGFDFDLAGALSGMTMTDFEPRARAA